MNLESRLARVLAAGHFAVTAECGPPQGADSQPIQEKGKLIKDVVDAVNVTDNQTAVVRLSSLASAVLLKEMGIEPVLQIVTRDRNRIALQSDLLGASALGVRNVLCLTGDHQSFGNQKAAQGVYDLDSIQLVYAARIMRDEGRLLDGTRLKSSPKLFIGAAANPFADPLGLRVTRLAKKIYAGANFIQTQCIYDTARFEVWLNGARQEGLTEKVYILGGVTPLKSVRMAEYMKANVAGIEVPDEAIKRIKGVPNKDQGAEGIKMAVETIEWLKGLDGVAGVHVMAIGWEEKVPEILEAAGLSPRAKLEKASQ
ncbi:MAG: methylenetetrahydrofolate reductase [Deltaproteobacteria bacterium]|nr:methylenetetrahydrofolate reductase [Deltaproteobacteria bacterium]MBW2050780.1 methylenetetrahydrofolate reductase [Deltaproteobacteria bacterium]MBW2139529.1 methylenetetrahydrofolate reductase [Deltaproteobacteria bacterium]MBW2321931.1 methylenetetrahydrofolate reductase [Deltaproteobacteria bacterium]